MGIPWQSIQGFAGATGVGALALLGVFFCTDGLAPNTFPAVEFYAKTATWGVVVAIPLLSIAYVTGLLAIGAADVISGRLPWTDRSDRIIDLVRLAGAADVISTRYQQLRQEQELLSGSALALLLLAVGALVERVNVPGWNRSIGMISLLTVVVAIASFALGASKGRMAHRLATMLPATARPQGS